MNSISQFVTSVCVCSLLPCGSHAQVPTTTDENGQPGQVFGSTSTPVFTPTTDQIQNGGLGVRLMFVGRNEDGKTLTVSAELQNITEEPVYLALVGPPPAAIDTSGVTYTLSKIGGLAHCQSLENRYVARCFTNGYEYLPPGNFNLLQPGAAAIVATTFSAEQASTSGFLSVTMNVLLAKGSRPKSKRSSDDALDNVAISFPVVDLAETK